MEAVASSEWSSLMATRLIGSSCPTNENSSCPSARSHAFYAKAFDQLYFIPTRRALLFKVRRLRRSDDSVIGANRNAAHTALRFFCQFVGLKNVF